jgi:hypothetical protein
MALILGATLSVVTLYLEQALIGYLDLDATRTGLDGSGVEALTLAVLTLLLVATSFLVSLPVNINRFSTHAAYRNRLVRTFLGASNSRRRCNLFTGFSRRDNFALAALAYHPFRRGRKRVREKNADPYQRPFHVLCGAVNDGGHFDNTAVYEMLRRRCSHILLIDADSTQNGISNLARPARVDLGVELHTKSAAFEDDLPCETYSVHYPSCSGSKAFTGTLVRVYPKLGKPSHWSTFESCEYKRVNEDFPNASLINQFFTESAFEAYRNLGFAILSEVIWRRKAPALRPKTPGIDAWTSLLQV